MVGEPILLVAANEKPARRGTIRSRVIIAAVALFALCIAMAYVTGEAPMVQTPSHLVQSDSFACNHDPKTLAYSYGTDQSEACKIPVSEWVRSKGPAEPNIIWFFFALWPGAIGALTAFGSWIATGRPW